MPFTIYHLGPSSWIGLLFFRSINFSPFLIASVIIDIEPFCVLFFKLNLPLHGFLHTFLGGTITALLPAFVMNHFKEKIVSVMKVFGLFQQSSFNKILFSCLLGIYSHIFLDSFFYTDIKPFFPLKINPLYNLVSSNVIYFLCGIAFILGAITYVIRLNRGKIRLVVLKVICSVTIFVFMLIILAIFWLSWYRSPFDDGPFLGTNYSEDIKGLPSSKITIDKNYLIEVYNDLDERAPIMVLRNSNGKQIWARLLLVSVEKEFENLKIHDLKLLRGRRTSDGYQIKGTVFWTFGHEAANFYLDERGNLKEFYLSW